MAAVHVQAQVLLTVPFPGPPLAIHTPAHLGEAVCTSFPVRVFIQKYVWVLSFYVRKCVSLLSTLLAVWYLTNYNFGNQPDIGDYES